MKTLLLLRHAKSSWASPELDDHDRPLNPRGQRTAPLMGKFAAQQGLLPDLIVSSTARRAQETTRLFVDESQFQGEVRFDEQIYLADVSTLISVLNDLPESANSVMLVGHNPGFEELVELLADHSGPFPTAALARIDLPVESWQQIGRETSGDLQDLYRPRELFD